MGVKDGTIRFVGICKGRDPFCWISDQCDDLLIDHDLKGFLYFLSAFSWDFPVSVLGRGYGGI